MERYRQLLYERNEVEIKMFCSKKENFLFTFNVFCTKATTVTVAGSFLFGAATS